MGVKQQVTQLASSVQFVCETVDGESIFIEVLVRIVRNAKEVGNAPIAGLPPEVLDD